MSTVSKLLEATKRLIRLSGKTTSNVKPTYGIPTIKFDASRVTETVKADIRKSIMHLKEIDQNNFDQVYDAALCSISRGGDLHVLYVVLLQLNINGMTKKRAAEISRFLNGRASAIMQRERYEKLGIKYAIWMYSGAPCELDAKHPTARDIRQNAAHKAANNQRYENSKGMFLDGKWTWPGMEPGCKCAGRPDVPGF